MKKVKYIDSFLPVEVVFFTYLLGSTLIILLFRNHLQFWIDELLIRMLATGLMLVLLWVKQNRLISFLRIFTPFLFLTFFYAETAFFNKLIYANFLDYKFAALDYALFGFQPSLEFSKYLDTSLFSELMFFGYFSYYVLTIGLPVYIYFMNDKGIGEKFAFIIVNSLLIFYVIFSLFPVAGPQYYFPKEMIQVPTGYVFEPLIRMIQNTAERPTGAFPSSHVSLCLMLVWGCLKYARKWLYVVVPTAILLILSTVYIGAHYAVDVVGGILITPAIYWCSQSIYDLLSKRNFKVVKQWT